MELGPATGERLETARPQVQSGVLAYRRTDAGELEVLLISKRRSKAWGIPKGKVKPHLGLGENAAEEAFEEAGVRGTLSPTAAGMYRAVKRNPGAPAPLLIEVWVYLLEVTDYARRWPERDKRAIVWAHPGEAAAQLREPFLADLCRRLAAGALNAAVP